MDEEKTACTESVGDRLKLIMKMRRVSPSRIAKKSGIDEDRLNSILNDGVEPTEEEMTKIAFVIVNPLNPKKVEKTWNKYSPHIDQSTDEAEK